MIFNACSPQRSNPRFELNELSRKSGLAISTCSTFTRRNGCTFGVVATGVFTIGLDAAGFLIVGLAGSSSELSSDESSDDSCAFLAD
ncbi:hypothetical protein DERP_006553 [Dermatophagoides pteronyssinus]|uniref:Uncharacterized protein n=1 Tax=Dermatophagoides pteronyssinus TaxID=6956 RepID=A0ABQ8IQJ9_DERPT|nr:hypothetical protein DERP_006553 [Dermatophagoides pteronyssinus]